MKQVQLKGIKEGEFFTLRPHEEPSECQVWVRGQYDHIEKKYECHKYDDMMHTSWMNGTRQVYTDFTF